MNLSSEQSRQRVLRKAPPARMLSDGQPLSSTIEVTQTGLQLSAAVHGLYLRSSRNLKMISPRSSNYERLEGGLGPSRIASAKRFAWKKFALAATVLIALVYLLGPKKSTPLGWKTKDQQIIPGVPSDSLFRKSYTELYFGRAAITNPTRCKPYYTSTLQTTIGCPSSFIRN